MRTTRMAGWALALALLAGTPATAQTTVDAGKITCDQWLTFKVADPDNIAIWLSGWVHARQNSTLIDLQQSKANIQRLKEICIRNPDITLMKLIEEHEKPKK